MLEIAIFPEQASSTAQSVDQLLLMLTVICGSVGLLVAFLLIYFSIRYRRRPGDVSPPPPTQSAPLLEWFWTLAPLPLFMLIFVWGAVVYLKAYRAGGRRGDLRDRQAMDVEIPASRGTARNQFAARASRFVRENAADLGGRDSQLFCAGVPRTHGRIAGAVYLGLFRTDEGWHVSLVLFAVLRDGAFDDDRRSGRTGAGRLSTLAAIGARRARWHCGGGRRSSNIVASVATVPTRTREGRC